jgi:hypothetical protein
MIKVEEVIPSSGNSREWKNIVYSRINVFGLTQTTLRNALEEYHVKKANVVETEDSFFYQYSEKEHVLILKRNGRLYSDTNSLEARKQAFILLEILHKKGLVVSFKRYHRTSTWDLWKGEKNHGNGV